MKNTLFLCLLLTFSALSAQLEYGVKAGINFADIHSSTINFGGGDDPTKGNTILKPQLGVWVNIPISTTFSIQPELLFTQKAWSPKGVPEPATVSFNYVSLPLMIAYHHNNWRFEAGPEINFLINQYVPERVGLPDNKSPIIDEQELELAINGGIRYHFNRLQLGVRYSIDYTPFTAINFTDINGETIAGNPLKLYHQGLQLMLGYSFVVD